MTDMVAALRGAKQALDEGLITPDDYDMVKIGFLKAQQLKAGLDAGFIREGDYDKARDAYLAALSFDMMSAAPTRSAAAAPAAAPLAAPPTAAPAPVLPETYSGSAPAAAAALMGAGNASGALGRVGSGALGGVGLGPLPSAGGSGGLASVLSSQGPGRAVGGIPQDTGGAQGAAFTRMRAATVPNGVAAGAVPPGGPSRVQLPPDMPDTCRGATRGKKSMSGIELSEDCVNIFNYIKTRSSNKWVTYKIDDAGSKVIIEQLGSRDSTWDEFCSMFREDQCKYGVFDCIYNSPERGFIQKLVFVNWAPDTASARVKMMYASTKDFLKGFLEGIAAELQATDPEELSEEEMLERVVGNMARK